MASTGIAVLRARSSSRKEEVRDEDKEKNSPRWRRRILLTMVGPLPLTWSSVIRVGLLIFVLTSIAVALFSLPVEKILKDFLVWVRQDLGPWGPVVLAIAYVPLTVLAVPASVLTLGGGYLFGLPIGFLSDSVGATAGATAAFILGRTVGRPYVMSKLKDYPKFQAVAVAVQRSGFKIVLLLRLVPILPFNVLNYLLSVTPVPLGEYILASWLGMMPITLALVYAGTTLKDLSDVTQGFDEVSTTRWLIMACGIGISVIMMIYITRVAKASLDKALEENGDNNQVDTLTSGQLPAMAAPPSPMDLQNPLIVSTEAMGGQVH